METIRFTRLYFWFSIPVLLLHTVRFLTAQPSILPLPASHPRDQLLSVGIDASSLQQFKDGESLGPADHELLWKILYRLPRFSLNKLEKWAGPSTSWNEIEVNPSLHRGDAVRVVGRAFHVERQSLPADAAQRLEFSEYFVVHVAMDGDIRTATVCCRTVPKAWRDATKLNERVMACGLFLKTGVASPKVASPKADTQTATSEIVIAASRIQWFPDEPRTNLGVARDHVLLAELGVDVGTIDDLQSRDGKPLEHADTECFYQVIAALGRASPQRFAEMTSGIANLSSLLRDPRQHRMQFLKIEGAARRITKILVENPEISERLGIDHYYQIDFFIPLGDLAVTLKGSQPGKKGPVFTNSFPATLCVPELPAGLSEGDSLRVPIVANAYFFRLWSFRSEYVAGYDDRMRQTSPLFLGGNVRIEKVEPVTNSLVGWILVGVIAMGIVGGAIGLYGKGGNSLMGRKDKKVLADLKIPEP